jgi:hypothetical protein
MESSDGVISYSKSGESLLVEAVIELTSVRSCHNPFIECLEALPESEQRSL